MNSIVNDGALVAATMFAVAASIAIATIALLRPWVRGRCGAVAALRLWWILPLALTVLTLPKQTIVEIQVQPASYGAPVAEVANAAADAAANPRTANAATDWIAILTAAWLAGAAFTAARMIRAQRRFSRRIDWKHNRRGVLPADSGPAVVGAFAPRLAVPADFAARYTWHERRLMLLHEAIHLRRRDGLANLAMSTLVALQWFNPLVHWAALALCRDQESACDALVVARHPGALRTYANALLKAHPEISYLPLVCRWQAYHPTVERIAMLKSHRHPVKRMKLAASALAGGAVLSSALIYAVEPATPVTVIKHTSAAPAAAATPKASTAAPSVTPRPRPAPAPVPVPVPVPVPAASATPAALPTPAPSEAPVPSASPAATPAPATPAPRARWDAPENISMKFNDVTLHSVLSVASTFTRTKFSGTEPLKAVSLKVDKHNVPLGQLLRVMLKCAGYAVQGNGDEYAIVRIEDAPLQTNPSACIDANIANGTPAKPEFVFQPAPPDQRYKIDITTRGEDSNQGAVASAILFASEPITFPIDTDLSIECTPMNIARNLYLRCVSLPALTSTDEEGRKSRFLHKVEFGKQESRTVTRGEKEFVLNFEVNKA